MDILEIAIAQRIGGADGEMVEALCAEICRLRSNEVVAWVVEDGITIREDFAAMLGWTGATVGTGRAIPKSWSPMLYSPMMANVEFSGGCAVEHAMSVDAEAVGWAYGKCVALGLENGSQESAMMMDRLKLMLGGYGV